MKRKQILSGVIVGAALLCVLCGCGKEETADTATEDTAAAAVTETAQDETADAAVPAGDTSASGEIGEASGEMASGEAGQPINGEGGAGAADPYDADWTQYSKDWTGYMQYVLDAFDSDANAPTNVRDSLAAAESEDDSTLAMLLDSGRIVTYDEFLAQ